MKKEIRVKHYIPNTDEVEYGTLIKKYLNGLYYKVVPDDHIVSEISWLAQNCELVD